MNDILRTPKTSLMSLDSASVHIGQEDSDAFSDYSAIEEDNSGDQSPKSDESEDEDDVDNASEWSWMTAGSALPPPEATAEKADNITLLPSQRSPLSVSSSYSNLSDLVAQLSPPGLAKTPTSDDSSPIGTAPENPGRAKAKNADFLAAVSPSILINARCSGYFVQPVSATPTLCDGGC